MVDQDVRITEVGLDSDSMWATEKTLEALLETIIKLSDVSADQKKELEKGFKDMAETGKVTRNNLKKTTSKAGGGNMFGDASSGLAGFTSGVVGAADDLDDLGSGPIKKFGKGLVGMTKKMGAMGIVAGAIMNQIGAAISTIKETVDAMRQLNSVGVTIEGDFMAFQEMLQTSTTTIEELAGITSKYARTVGNVGLRSLVNMTAAAENSTFAFKNYGLRLAEATEWQAEMLEADRLGGLIKKRDTAEQSLMLAENVKTLSAYSKILNVSREDMIKQRIALKSRADVQRRFNSMDDKSRIAANASFDQFSDLMTALGDADGLTDMMTTIIADPAAVYSEAFTQLAGTAPEVAQAALDLREKIIAGEDIGPKDVIDRMLGPLDEASKSGQIEMVSMNDALGETANLLGGPVLNSMRNWTERLAPLLAEGLTQEEAIQKLGESTNASVQKATEAQTELDRFAATVKNARVKVFDNLLGQEASSIMDSAIGGLRIASEKIDELGGYDYRGGLEKIVESFQLYVVEPFRTSMLWLDGVIESIKTGFSTFFTWLKDIPARIWNAMAAVLPIDPVELPSAAASKIGASWDAAHPNRPSYDQVTDARSDITAANQSLQSAKADANSDQAKLELAQATLDMLTKHYNELRRQRYAASPEG